MARFRLIGPHYLNMEIPSEWEQKETDRTTGKQFKKVYKIPTHLDPKEPADCNYDGEIIVSTKADPKFPRDLVFKGPPTMDMQPLDEEAEELLKTINNIHPIESLSGTFGDHLIRKFEEQLQITQKKAEESVSAKDSEIAELRQQIIALTQLVQGLIPQPAAPPAAPAPAARRA